MGPEAILLSVRDDGHEGSYRFTCPGCADDVEKRADRKIVALLVSAGVDVASRGTITEEAERDPPERLFEEPEQILDPLDRLPDGPRLSADDLIDFHFRLQDDAYIQEFLAKR